MCTVQYHDFILSTLGHLTNTMIWIFLAYTISAFIMNVKVCFKVAVAVCFKITFKYTGFLRSQIWKYQVIFTFIKSFCWIYWCKINKHQLNITLVFKKLLVRPNYLWFGSEFGSLSGLFLVNLSNRFTLGPSH